MIQVERIRIREFRGIRDLELDFHGENFVVFGPNGSGKSGVVDAIDFALTGDIARLSGPGMGSVSVAAHGPHVTKRNDPAAAQVILTVRDTKTNKGAALTRTVKTPSSYTLDPELPAVRSAVDRASQHSELTLSRREIIKYIVAEPGKRSEQVQALLKLDRMGQVRSLLKAAQNKVSGEDRLAAGEVAGAEGELLRHLDLTILLISEVLAPVNKRRSVLGLGSLSGELKDDTDLAAGAETGVTQSPFNKASAIRDVEALISWNELHLMLPAEGVELLTALDELETDPHVFTLLRLRSLTEAGLRLVTDDTCPLCDRSWSSSEELRDHLMEKLVRSQTAADLQSRITSSAASLGRHVLNVRELIRSVGSYAGSGTAELRAELHSWSEDLARLAGQIGTTEGAMAQRDRLKTAWLGLPEAVDQGLGGLLVALHDLPDQSATSAASTFLTIAQERWTRLRLARAKQVKSATAHKAADAIYTTYCTTMDEALTDLYNSVEQDFSSFYSQINSDNEFDFKAEFAPSMGKLDLKVAFHGQGMFPPSAYHSEGHQDGMGVCLYLALVKQLLGEDFRFAVLDDVVMSVDSNHRRQFCALLKSQFPNVQFVLTTHDETWAAQMRTVGLVKKANQAQFRGWTVEDGPIYETGLDFWHRTDADLINGDIPAAAAGLRRNLEFIMQDLTLKLRGQVTYKADNRYDFGDYLSAVKGRHGKLLGKAKKAAVSWGDTAAIERINKLNADRVAAELQQQDEGWAVNTVVHYNEGKILTKSDFVPALAAAREYVGLFLCENTSCDSFIYVTTSEGSDESLCCGCGQYQFKLRPRTF